MKKYFKIDNFEDEGIIQYGEYAAREVNFYDLSFYEHKDKESEWELSVNDEDLGLKGWPLDYLELSSEESIAPEEFEKVWQKALKLHIEQEEKKAKEEALREEEERKIAENGKP